MKIISFARTTPALAALRKSVTRREWTEKHHNRFRVGETVQAWSASPHRRGHKVGEILITSLTREHTSTIPDSDWEAEGFAFMEEHGLLLNGELSVAECWRRWKADPELVTSVIRFEVVRLEGEVHV